MEKQKLYSKSLQIKSIDAKEVDYVETEITGVEENQVVIKVQYVPLIHYDLMKMSGVTGAKFPYTPCVELSGIIHWAHDKNLIGKKVSFLSLKFGVLQSKVVASLDEVLIIKDDTSLVDGCLMSCNPFTACGIVDMAETLKTKAFAITAGNSSVCKIINRIAFDKGIKCISIVRSEKRRAEMLNEGFDYVVDSSDVDFVLNLNKIMTELEANVIFDTLSGPVVGQLMKALPKNGLFVNFGTQTHLPMSGIDATDMRWGNKEMKNFLVGTWIDAKIKEKSFEKFKSYVTENPKLFKTEYGKIFKIKDFKEAVDYANNSDSNLKTIIDCTDEF